MGVEPTVACSAQPTTNFEDWGIHRDTYTPTSDYNRRTDLGLHWVARTRMFCHNRRSKVTRLTMR